MFLRRFIAVTILIVLLAGCGPVPQPTLTETVALPPTPQPTATSISTATPVPPTPTSIPALTLWLDPSLPDALSEGLTVPADIETTAREAEATYRWVLLGLGETAAVETDWVFVAAAAFPTIPSEVSGAKLRGQWQRGGGQALLLTPESLAAFTALWGKPAVGAVKVVADEAILDAAWENQGQVALLPFEQLSPRWKALRVDGLSPFDRDFNAAAYPLALRAGLTGADALPEGWALPLSNYDSTKLTTLMLTGVTALARRTAKTINEQGTAFLVQDTGGWLRSADITHVSNEVSFNEQCSPERAASPEARFCSIPEYIEVLELAGTDIVELTGNHNLDYGPEAYMYTLDLYRERGWVYYGGGENAEEARQALLVEHNGNRLAFIGCNYAGPEPVWATETYPGAATCDLDWIEAEVIRLAGEGYLPVVTFQTFESEDYKPAIMQRAGDYRRMAAAGAVVVSGSASHWPQTFEFVGDSLLHFGLGNLFFDQMERFQTRQAFQDKHVFYDGRYLGLEFLPTMLEDAARPRPMTAAERETFLTDIFEAGGW